MTGKQSSTSNYRLGGPSSYGGSGRGGGSGGGGQTRRNIGGFGSSACKLNAKCST